MKTRFDAKKKQALLVQFKTLETLKEKLFFWEKEIEQPYIKFLVYMDATDNLIEDLKKYYCDLAEFRVFPKPSEYKEYNLKMIQGYSSFMGLFNRKKLPKSLRKKIEDFEKRGKDVVYNRKQFIEKEIEVVKHEIEENSKKSQSFFDNSNDFFKDTYESVYYRGEGVDYSEQFFVLWPCLCHTMLPIVCLMAIFFNVFCCQRILIF